MAIVPRKVSIDTDLRPVAGDKFHAADFGSGYEAVGQAGQRLAGQVSELADQKNRIDAHLDEAGAKDRDNAFVRDSQAIRAKVLAAQGLNAGVAVPDATAELRDLYNHTLGEATTERMRGMLKQSLDGRVLGYRTEWADHVTKETTAGLTTAENARIGLAAEEAAAAVDPDARARNMSTGLGEIETRNTRLGLDPAVTTADKFKFESNVHTSILTNMVVGDKVDNAVAYFSTNKGRMTDGDKRSIASLLKDPLERRETYSDVDGVMGSMTRTGSSFSYTDPLHGAGGTPVKGGEFGAARDYGDHQGVDVPAPLGSPIYSAGGAGVAMVKHSEKGGTILEVDHGDGRVSRYMHLGSTKVQDGDEVTPDTVIGTVGMTGRTTGPHLHWEERVNGKPVDPATTIGRAQQSPQRHDLNATLAGIDKAADTGGWTIERRMRAKGEVERRVGRDEQLQTRSEADALRRALDVIDKLPDRSLTTLDQIPADIRAALGSDDRIKLSDMASRNVKGDKVKADGDGALSLNLMALQQPDRFKKLDLRLFRDDVTPGEFASLAVTQTKMRQAPPGGTDHEKIWGTITRYAPDLSLNLKTKDGKFVDPKSRSYSMRIFSTMKSSLDGLTGGTRQPTDDEVKRAFDNATMNVGTDVDNWWSGTHPDAVPRYKVEDGRRTWVDIDPRVRQRIVESLKRSAPNRQPKDDEVTQIYLTHRGEPGFWQ